jgi:alcohol dehydrogenase class IV
MDALTHAAEAIMSTKAMPPSDALALHAIKLIRDNLLRAVENGGDLEARSAMLVAAAEAGQAFQNAFVGVVHALAHALGGLLGVPHGLANAIMLWAGMEYNAPASAQRVALVGQAMGVKRSGDDQADAAAAVAAMREFTRKLGLPERLSELGVTAGRIEQCAELALADAALFTNPRRPQDASELLELYKKCM